MKGEEGGVLDPEDSAALVAQNGQLKASLEDCRKELFNVYQQARAPPHHPLASLPSLASPPPAHAYVYLNSAPCSRGPRACWPCRTCMFMHVRKCTCVRVCVRVV